VPKGLWWAAYVSNMVIGAFFFYLVLAVGRIDPEYRWVSSLAFVLWLLNIVVSVAICSVHARKKEGASV
jgi:hypothetical protein